MGDCSGVNGEERAVDEGIAGGEVNRGVSLVSRLVKHSVCINDLRNIITFTSVVPNVVIVDGDVGGIPCVGVPNREDDRGSGESAEETVEDTVEGVDKWVSGDGKLVPVPGWEGVETKAADSAGDSSQGDVIRGDPGHPVEVGHGHNNVVGEPEVDEHGAKTVKEPPHPRDGPTVDGLIDLGMEGTLREDQGIRTHQGCRRVPPLTFSAIVAKLDGQTARDGYTRKRLVSPARPYPIKLVERATRTRSLG